MGLELVELVLEVEEKFGIKIEDEEYEFCPTVRDLHDLIIRKHGRVPGKRCSAVPREPTPCLSLAAFVRLRRALMSLFDVPRNLVRPATTLEQFLPVDLRLTRWADLARELGLDLPALTRPQWLRWLLGLGWSPLVALLLSCASLGLIDGPALLAGLLVTVVLTCVSWPLTRPLAVCLEPALCTVGGLSKAILARNYRLFADKHPIARNEDVMTALIAIISESLMIPVDEIKPEVNFVDDLGCG